MTVNLDIHDLKRLLHSIYPISYEHPFSHLGKISGFPGERWYWNEQTINGATEQQLWEWYQEIKSFNIKNSHTGYQ